MGADFKEWTRDTGEEVLKQADFNTALEALKHSKKRGSVGFVWEGLKLKSAATADDLDW